MTSIREDENVDSINENNKRTNIKDSLDEADSDSDRGNDHEVSRRKIPRTGLKLAPTIETDPKKIESRLKQIKFGKNTIGYDNYTAQVPMNKRRGFLEHPRTPDPYEISSKRAFDGRVKAWRRQLHKWDETSGANPPVFNFGSTSDETLDDVLRNKASAKIKEDPIEVKFEAYMSHAKSAKIVPRYDCSDSHDYTNENVGFDSSALLFNTVDETTQMSIELDMSERHISLVSANIAVQPPVADGEDLDDEDIL